MSKITRAIVRPVITLIFAGGITYGFLADKITAETYVPIAAVAITWWFSSRDNEKNNPVEPPK